MAQCDLLHHPPYKATGKAQHLVGSTFTVYKNATDVPPSCCAVATHPDGPLLPGELWRGDSPSVCSKPTAYLVVIHPLLTGQTPEEWKDLSAHTGACEKHIFSLRAMQDRLIEIAVYVEPDPEPYGVMFADGVFHPLHHKGMSPNLTFDPQSIIVTEGTHD